jgi:hypothetical protein
MRRAVWAALALIAAAPCQAAPPPKTDAQLWSEVDLTIPASQAVSANFLAVSRYGATLPNPTLAGGGGMLDWRLGGWALTAGDLAVDAREAGSGKSLGVNVPLAAVSYGWTIGGLALSERARFENLLGVPGDPWRLRNRVLAEHKISGLGVLRSVFASDEVFYDLGRDQWSRNRAQLGVGLTLARQVAFDIYYMRQDDRFNRPGGLNIAGLTLKLEVK